MKIKWKSRGEGTWSSHDGRFVISPSYRSRTAPSDYTVEDQKTGGHSRYDTVREAKARAAEIIEYETNPPPPRPPPQYEPSLSDADLLSMLESEERAFAIGKKYYPESAIVGHEERLACIRTLAGEERWSRLINVHGNRAGHYEVREIGWSPLARPMDVDEYAWQVAERLVRVYHDSPEQAQNAVNAAAHSVRKGHEDGRKAQATAKQIKFDRGEI